MNILIIGGNGFIGGHLVESLKTQHSITVFDRSPNRFKKEHPEVHYVYGDYNEWKKHSHILKDQDIVFHLISTTVPYTANLDPINDVQSNLLTTLHLLEDLDKYDIQRFIYTSSGGTVYGNPNYLPIDEKHPCQPIGSYGIVKNCIENYVRMYASRFSFSYLIVRPSNPYGPGQNFRGNQGLIAKLLFKSHTQEEMVIWGDGTAVRDYIYIKDLVDFLKVAGLSNISGTYNIGSGLGKSINEIVELLAPIVPKLPPLKYSPTDKSIVQEVVLDISAAKENFSWEPQVKMEQGLLLQKDWIDRHIESNIENIEAQ
ncbi:NAD-dependent epimerase/dehydratase family protein [Salinimicrobium sp. HB62]|uniref:NAD-dependent epimerase/dehydratase family protein n=1 Tax=Salinimicrobium sp. HB62 TaxID=3077781 RepID=UPI002D7829B0|nr:NAD-dependent epimerase/dehydratase family protein [Salinimicrobium sp. HB62]